MMDAEIHIYTDIYEMQAVPSSMSRLYLCYLLWLQLCSVLFLQLLAFIHLPSLCAFGAARGLPDCQCKLKSPVLAAFIE